VNEPLIVRKAEWLEEELIKKQAELLAVRPKGFERMLLLLVTIEVVDKTLDAVQWLLSDAPIPGEQFESDSSLALN